MAETANFTAKELKEIIRNDKMDISAETQIKKLRKKWNN